MSQALSKAKLSSLRKFHQKKTRQAEGRFLIEGWHLLDEALKAKRRIHALIYQEDPRRASEEEDILTRAVEVSSEAFVATSVQLSQLSDTKCAQGVAALIDAVGVSFDELERDLPASGPLRLVLLDDVSDPGNCGSIVRASDWFGMDGIVLGNGCAELENGKTARSSMGGMFHLPVATDVDLPATIARLQALGVSLVTTELEAATSLEGFVFPNRCALVIGNEARGVSKTVSEQADARVFAPRFGGGESLNAALAAAVFLARWRLS
ncbi:RNA methyltransferase [Pelagicoccus sp. SDUM812003]|uniref:TrmH family RNA methyltransferase n=1 Tax=Pelagicoccus sp. SDUM812003 TaxID=3041267 RepID=UPI0028103A76|nr:RNA methyltransferase [Pelagicoccus sp. SDUM812003]MDQ8203451.1 RNA methyltransferase [Pelagicoccus sp. SDUM812003]